MNEISPWVGVAGVTLSLILAVVAFAFWAGRLSERVDKLKADGDGHTGLALAFAAFQAEMRADMKNLTANFATISAWIEREKERDRPTPRSRAAK